MAVLAFVDDLIFRSKLQAAAAQAGEPLTVADGAGGLGPPPSGTTWDLVIVDLELTRTDPVVLTERVRQALPKIPIVGYCSHVEVELQTQAKMAGCTEVLARSSFVQRLPELLADHAEESARKRSHPRGRPGRKR